MAGLSPLQQLKVVAAAVVFSYDASDHIAIQPASVSRSKLINIQRLPLSSPRAVKGARRNNNKQTEPQWSGGTRMTFWQFLSKPENGEMRDFSFQSEWRRCVILYSSIPMRRL